jgi:hypothetical protein
MASREKVGDKRRDVPLGAIAPPGDPSERVPCLPVGLQDRIDLVAVAFGVKRGASVVRENGSVGGATPVIERACREATRVIEGETGRQRALTLALRKEGDAASGCVTPAVRGSA